MTRVTRAELLCKDINLFSDEYDTKLCSDILLPPQSAWLESPGKKSGISCEDHAYPVSSVSVFTDHLYLLDTNLK